MASCKQANIWQHKLATKSTHITSKQNTTRASMSNRAQRVCESEGARSGNSKDKSVAGGHSGFSEHHKKVTSIFNHFSLKVFCFLLDLVILICFHVYLAMELRMSAFWFCALITKLYNY